MESAASQNLAKPLSLGSNLNKILLLAVVLSVVLGLASGFSLSNKSSSGLATPATSDTKPAKSAAVDTKTFRDFAEGVIKPIPTPKDGEYTEGTHILERDGAYPVTLTSSVVDLSKYEGKKVKVYGETQKALKSGWLMDVGKVEEK